MNLNKIEIKTHTTINNVYGAYNWFLTEEDKVLNNVSTLGGNNLPIRSNKQ